MEHWTEYTRFFIALFVILNPFAALPVFLSLTPDYSTVERGRTAMIAALSVSIVLIVAAIFGEAMLSGLGTSLASFRVGGGIVLLLMALAMLKAETDPVRTTADETGFAERKASIAVVPLALPLLAGPGSISTVIIEVHRSTETFHLFPVIGVIVLVGILVWGVLSLAMPVSRLLGIIGLNILNRLFGLLLTAIAVEVMANGLRELFPILRG